MFGREEASKVIDSLSKKLVQLRELSSLREESKQIFETKNKIQEAKKPENEVERQMQQLQFAVMRKDIGAFEGKVRIMLATFGVAAMYAYRLFTGGKELTDEFAVVAEVPGGSIESEFVKLFFVDLLREKKMELIRSPPLLEMTEVDGEMIDWIEVWLEKLRKNVVGPMFGADFADGERLFTVQGEEEERDSGEISDFGILEAIEEEPDSEAIEEEEEPTLETIEEEASETIEEGPTLGTIEEESDSETIEEKTNHQDN
jgi:hypothetical protein